MKLQMHRNSLFAVLLRSPWWGSALVACKRWKAVRTGVEPLREFHAAAAQREAHERIYIAAGEVTDNARAFAAEKSIRLLQGEELAALLH
ncbi:MAG TPA: restriction endonuclease [Burkholderiales bacterium]|nr:restriction endonuclease [Burkholderiales bacterium]